MANPANPGTFNFWITDRIVFQVMPPKSGDTGDFNRWLTDTLRFDEYVEAAVVEAAIYNKPIHWYHGYMRM